MMATRKRNTVKKDSKTLIPLVSHETQYAEVPYTSTFQLTIATRTMDDALQIVEQILAFLTPEFTITLNYSDFNAKVDLPITIQSVNPEGEYDGDTTQRNIIFNMDFAQTFVFAPTKLPNISKKKMLQIHNFYQMDQSLVRLEQHQESLHRSLVIPASTRCHLTLASHKNLYLYKYT